MLNNRESYQELNSAAARIFARRRESVRTMEIPKDSRHNFCVMIKMHTKDARRVLSDPAMVRDIVGEAIDGRQRLAPALLGREQLEEEIDYTLDVYRTESDKDSQTERIAKAEQLLAQIETSDNAKLLRADQKIAELEQQVQAQGEALAARQRDLDAALSGAEAALQRMDAQGEEIERLKSYQANYEHATCIERSEFKQQLSELKATLARFQSDRPELGDLSFREQLRSQLIVTTLKENEELQAKCERLSAPVSDEEWQAALKKQSEEDKAAVKAMEPFPSPFSHSIADKIIATRATQEP